MLRHVRFHATVAVLLLSTTLSWAQTYVADRVHSNIGFTVRHMLIANVSGQFKDYEVSLFHDPTDITKSWVKATIKAASLDTENERRDNHLRSADFFDAENHPDITFTSKKIMQHDKGYVAVGDLTMRGVTKEIELPFVILGRLEGGSGKGRLGIAGGLTLNRMDYGVKWDKRMDNGGLIVGEEVQVQLSISAVEQ